MSEETAGLTYDELARLYGTTWGTIRKAVDRLLASVPVMGTYLAQLPSSGGRLATYVLGPGIFLVGRAA